VDEIVISFTKYDKYFARKDINSPWWTKLDVEMWRCLEFNTLTSAEKICWIGLISLCGKARKNVITINTDWFSQNAGIRRSDVISGISKFVKLQWISEIRTDCAHETPETRALDKIRSDKKEERVKTSFSPLCFLNLWNSNCDALPKALALSDKRKLLAGARIKENSDPNYWKDVIERIAASDFCVGKNDRGWMASFDFLLKPDTHIKVLEGMYGAINHKKEKNEWECDAGGDL